jgi:hypothetical protein
MTRSKAPSEALKLARNARETLVRHYQAPCNAQGLTIVMRRTSVVFLRTIASTNSNKPSASPFHARRGVCSNETLPNPLKFARFCEANMLTHTLRNEMNTVNRQGVLHETRQLYRISWPGPRSRIQLKDRRRKRQLHGRNAVARRETE